MLASDRNDEKVACQKILDKIGLQGYQVKHALLIDLLLHMPCSDNILVATFKNHLIVMARS
jgi:hypothetical protein